MRPATRDLIGFGIAWGIIAACAACLVCGLFGCAATAAKPAQTVQQAPTISAPVDGPVTQDTDSDAHQSTDQTSGGQAPRAETINGNQTANQFDLSRNQLLLLLAVVVVVLIGGGVMIVGAAIWMLFLGWFSPAPNDAVVKLLGRVYLIAFPAGVLLIGLGVMTAIVWWIIRAVT